MRLAAHTFTHTAQDAADPLPAVEHAAPTPHAVELQLEYVYFSRVTVALKQVSPIANIPRVELPVADPK